MKKINEREKTMLRVLIREKIDDIEDNIAERKVQITGMTEDWAIENEKQEIKWLEQEKQEWKEIIEKIKITN